VRRCLERTDGLLGHSEYSGQPTESRLNTFHIRHDSMKFIHLQSEKLFKVGNFTCGVSAKRAAAARKSNEDRCSASSICAAMQRDETLTR